ncbi:MAG: hypothetical protein PHD31_01400 [Candidatus Pacebacteria bacterium]|nr:hypothetical protein [Candidatus Paceibacterota bacterium]
MDQTQEQNSKSPFAEVFFRKLLGIFLLLSAFPLLVNPITIPLIILCLVFAIYMLSGKKYNLTLDLLGLIIGCILYFLGVFNSLKVVMFYTAQSNNDFVVSMLFCPAIILLLISSLFMFFQGILYENDSYKKLKNRGLISFGIVIVSILLVFGLPMTKHLQVKIGLIEGMNPNGSKQNVLISFDAANKEWTYIVKRKNETDKPLVLISLFKNKQQIMENDENVVIKNGIMDYDRLTIEPFNEATITIRSTEPIYTMTFTMENSLADSYTFVK